MPHPEYRQGQTLHGFTITGITELPELNFTLLQLRHDRTGARMVHIANEDDNNLFSVGFRTPPSDSTGVAHILEHTALCGSERYPVRDPFFSMLKRSLNTFMNAMTASDWTMYPFSSQNRADFYNLMDIYLDAAFFPLLRERDFRQEGHRLEFAEPDNPDSPLQFKGVVYNEMKGAMASPSSLLSRRLSRALYPQTTYGQNSGGEPSDIPDLTWEELRAFHARFYHPSNAWIFSYGNLPLEEHLEVIDRRALGCFEAAPVKSAVPPEPPFDKPKRITETFPLDPGESLEKRSMVQVAWLTSDITDSYERLALSVLSSLLLGNPAAPLYKALLDSGLGSNLAPGTGYSDENRTTAFAAGLQGTDPDKAEEIEQLVLQTLGKAAEEGFSPERIEGTLHRLEFGHREVTGNHYPYPLALLMRIMGPWLHGEDPVTPLRLDENLARLRREVAEGPFFQDLIRKRLLENPHRVTLTLRPDPEQKKREEEQTALRLAAIEAKLTDEEKERIVAQARELQAAQEAEEDLSCLPTLTRDDIPAEERPIPSELTDAEYDIRRFEQPTNGIGYFVAHLPTGHLPEGLLPYVPLFCTMLTQIGAAGFSHLEMAERMEAGTGGIRAGTEILESPGDQKIFEGTVEISGKALIRNQEKLFSILGDLCTAPDFTDLERLRTVLGQMRATLENSIPSSGHSYAARSAAGTLTAACALRERWGGLTQVRLIKKATELQGEELQEIAEKLQQIADALFRRELFRCALTAEAGAFEAMEEHLRPFLDRLPADKKTEGAASRAPFAPASGRQGWAASVPVSYVSRVFPTVPYTDPDAGVLMVLSKLLRAGYLHREIREKGGAYGGMAGCNAEAGTFSMLSYRDPHLVRTLRVYDDASAWAAEGRFDQQQITEAVLAVFSDLDRPLSPSGRASREFSNIRQGLTPQIRQELRERVLAVDRKALMAAAERHLRQGRAASAVAVISGEDALKKANEELGDEGLRIERI